MSIKSMICAAFASLMLVACASEKPSYTVTGTVSGVEDGTVVELIPTATHSDDKPVAVTTIEGGKFVATGSVEQPIACVLHIGENGYETFMLENANIQIVADVAAGGSFKSVQITGSEYTDIFKQKMAFRDSLNVYYEKYHEDYEKALKEAEQEKNAKKAAQMKKEAYDVMAKAEGEFFDMVEEVYMRVFKANKDEFWGPMLVLYNLNYFAEGDPTYVELYNSYPEEVKNSYYGKLLHAQLYPPTLVGGQLPDMNGMDKNGVQQSLKELCKGKKYVIVDFWASWCGPCRKSIPALKEFYAKYAPKGVEIVGVSIDKREADWKKALEQEQLPWANIIDSEGVNGSVFLVRAVPTMLVVDENGVVVSDNFYDADERAKWCETFDKL